MLPDRALIKHCSCICISGINPFYLLVGTTNKTEIHTSLQKRRDKRNEGDLDLLAEEMKFVYNTIFWPVVGTDAYAVLGHICIPSKLEFIPDIIFQRKGPGTRVRLSSPHGFGF